MKTNVYIDGFNFYYGMFRTPRWLPWKWLDVRQLSQRLAPNDQIHRIRYFTAPVSAPPHDLDRPIRQQTYFRALRTLPGLTIHSGAFLTSPKHNQPVIPPIPIPTCIPPLNPGSLAEVRRALDAIVRIDVMNTEEKGSDVNIATFMLTDAFDQDCEKVLLISNDSDLAMPAEVLRTRFSIEVFGFNPGSRNDSVQLRRACSTFRQLRPGVLEQCQLPNPVLDAKGREIHMPAQWGRAEQRFRARRGH